MASVVCVCVGVRVCMRVCMCFCTAELRNTTPPAEAASVQAAELAEDWFQGLSKG